MGHGFTQINTDKKGTGGKKGEARSTGCGLRLLIKPEKLRSTIQKLNSGDNLATLGES